MVKEMALKDLMVQQDSVYLDKQNTVYAAI